MPSRFFNAMVVVVWLTTMGWLVVSKVLPPLYIGDPPNYRTIIAAESGLPEPPVCWGIRWNGDLLGWAISDVVHAREGMSELRSRVYFSRLPLDEMSPRLLEPLIQPIVRQFGKLDMDAMNSVEIDPLGRLTAFDSQVRVASMHEAIRIQGRMDDLRLRLLVQFGGNALRTERTLPADALVGDELSPQARLPGLRLGQTWTMPVYSPWRPHSDTMEILHAKVERQEQIVWNNESVDALVVVYRPDPGATLLYSREPRGKLWVRPDGAVLRQEVRLFNSRLNFTRLPESVARVFAASLGENLRAELTARRANSLLEDIELAERVDSGLASEP